mmetsp:Transcript_9328/g.14719  ORF Transcript_9328/g.14719 Transcript_9328/m.14719 type:complete len:269 (-) Transcript_9328:82-888(-)
MTGDGAAHPAAEKLSLVSHRSNPSATQQHGSQTSEEKSSQSTQAQPDQHRGCLKEGNALHGQMRVRSCPESALSCTSYDRSRIAGHKPVHSAPSYTRPASRSPTRKLLPPCNMDQSQGSVEGEEEQNKEADFQPHHSSTSRRGSLVRGSSRRDSVKAWVFQLEDVSFVRRSSSAYVSVGIERLKSDPELLSLPFLDLSEEILAVQDLKDKVRRASLTTPSVGFEATSPPQSDHCTTPQAAPPSVFENYYGYNDACNPGTTQVNSVART